MTTIADLGEPTLETSGRTPLRLWVVEYKDIPDEGCFIPTTLRSKDGWSIWLVVAPMEVNDGNKGNGKAQAGTAEAVRA